MRAKQQRLNDQIRYASAHSRVAWGAVLLRSAERWLVKFSNGLTKSQTPVLQTFLSDRKTTTWLDGVGTRPSSYRTVAKSQSGLAAKRVYALSSPHRDELLLVGADSLKKADITFLGAILDQPTISAKMPSKAIPPRQRAPIAGSSLDLSTSLRAILNTITEAVQADFGLLSVRAGDEFTIEAAFNLSADQFPDGFYLGEETELYHQIQTQRSFLLTSALTPAEFPSLPGANWLAVPVVIGQRLIGALFLGREADFEDSDYHLATAIGSHVAPSVEKSILSDEAAYYLHRFALLNELAGFGGAGLGLLRVIQRGEMMMRRAFDATTARITLYDEERGEIQPSGLPVENAEIKKLERSVLEIEQVLRIDNMREISSVSFPEESAQSKMVVPMKFRGQVVGVLSLESDRLGAFSEQDEVFITVLASQLASIILNSRLNSEMAHRAGAMEAVNEIVQEILGLSDLSLIASRTAQLMAEKFDHGLVLVMLLDTEMDELIAEGVDGVTEVDIPSGFRFSRNLGIPGEVMTFGNSVLLQDVRRSSDYVPIPGWEPGSGMWVPLRTGADIFGVLSVEYEEKGLVNENDMAVLEAIGGILSSVITNARQYEQLQQTVAQLEAVRETALDIGTDLDLEILLKRVVNRVRALIDAHGAELGFVDQENEVIEVLVSENPWQEYSGYRFDFNQGVTGRVAARGEPLTIADFNSWRGQSENTFKAPFTTVAGVPLMLLGEVIGTLVVQDDRPAREFTQRDIRTLELLAPQLAIFIRNARLYQELETRMEAQRLAEERLVRSAKLAAVGEMAAAVAHELNNPLTTVTGFAELLLESFPEDSPEFEDMSLVLKEAQRSREVVRRLLDFSRQSDLLRVDTDLNEIITTVLQMIHHLATTENITVRMELWDDIPMIRADRNQINQVILNLVHNALQAMPDGGELFVQSLIEVREEQTWVGIRVKDTGMGIPEKDINQIFEPFFTTKPSGEGTGLGLSVSYSIISEHGGYIDVVSVEGLGAMFTIWLPAQRDEQEGSV